MKHIFEVAIQVSRERVLVAVYSGIYKFLSLLLTNLDSLTLPMELSEQENIRPSGPPRQVTQSQWAALAPQSKVADATDPEGTIVNVDYYNPSFPFLYGGSVSCMSLGRSGGSALRRLIRGHEDITS